MLWTTLSVVIVMAQMCTVAWCCTRLPNWSLLFQEWSKMSDVNSFIDASLLDSNCAICTCMSCLTWGNFLSTPCFLQVTLSPTSQACSILLEFSAALLCSIAVCLRVWMACQSARIVIGRIMSLPNTSCAGVAFDAV